MPRRIEDQFADQPMSRQKRYRLRMKAAGNCIVCGKPAVNKNHCDEHRKRTADANADRAKKKREKFRAENPNADRRKTKTLRVYHPAYGSGVIVSGDNDIAVVQFDLGGRKRLLRAFLSLV